MFVVTFFRFSVLERTEHTSLRAALADFLDHQYPDQLFFEGRDAFGAVDEHVVYVVDERAEAAYLIGSDGDYIECASMRESEPAPARFGDL